MSDVDTKLIDAYKVALEDVTKRRKISDAANAAAKQAMDERWMAESRLNKRFNEMMEAIHPGWEKMHG